MSKVQNIVVNGIHNQRLDNFLNSKYKHIPMSHIYKMIRQGQVRVNKKRAKPMNKLNNGDILRLPPAFSCGFQKYEKKVKWKLEQSRVLYDVSDLLIVDKPPNLAVHSGSNTDWGLIDVLTSQYGSNCKLVHRLDKDTSGVMLIAKNQKMAQYCHSLILDRKVIKRYVLVVQGNVKEKKFKVNKEIDGKTAITNFRLIKSNDNYSLLSAELVTGRKHQIRLHVREFSHSIVGDQKYGYNQKNNSRLMLHAYYIKLPLVNGTNVEISCNYPDSFNDFFK